MPGNLITKAEVVKGMIAALFVEKNGVYFDLPGVDPWDEERDARLYDGPWPVVAHPPCKRWGRFAGQVERRFGHRIGDDAGCFQSALEAVHTYGGVIEHPAYSHAWDWFDLPEPKWRGGWTHALNGGASCYVEQWQYGHPAKKATWLYAYGVGLPELQWGYTPDNAPGHSVRWSKVRYPGDDGRERLPREWNNRTPPGFRDVLIAMARSAHGRSLEHARASDRPAA
jgi:hypothetical protein